MEHVIDNINSLADNVKSLADTLETVISSTTEIAERLVALENKILD